MNNKGQLETMLVGIVLVLVSTIVLFSFYKQMITQNVDDNVERCKLSVALAAGAKSLSGGAIDLGSSCPRTRITFTNERPEQISDRIASEMYWCAERFNFGNIDFTPLTNVMPPTKFNCLVCATYSFENPVLIERYTANKDQFREYTTKELIPGQTQTFKSYFMSTNNRADNHEQNLKFYYNEQFDPRESQVIVFANVQKGSLFTRILNQKLWWALDYATYQLGVEDPYPTNYILMGPSDKVLAYCDNILN